MSEVIIGLLGVLVGTLLGNWMALGRDKRREYNKVVNPMRATLLKAEDELKKGYSGRAFNDEDLLDVRRQSYETPAGQKSLKRLS
jgi:hypothetical protein